MLFAIISLVVLHFFLPAYLIYALFTSDYEDRFEWLLIAVTGSALVIFLALAGRWDWFSAYLRFVPLILFAGAVALSYPRTRGLPFLEGSRYREHPLSTGWQVLEALIAIGLAAFAALGYFHPANVVNLSFPLENGDYYVAHGGSTYVVNYHHPNTAQAYASDITALNPIGARARGIYPHDRDRYTIYGATIISPCDGTITDVENDLPGHVPPERDAEHPAGNHVLIACNGVSVLLAHMQQGSVMVERGDTVTTGQPLGKVGNSGNTSEPHLHIHAVEGQPDEVLGGTGIPILFDGTFPTRNTVFRR